MSDIKLWYEGNDMVIEISNVIDKITSNTIDDATVNATLKDPEGVDVTGISWPQVVSFVSAGLYRKTIDQAVDVIDKGAYVLHLDLTTPGGIDAHWEIPVGGETRKS